jgi:hypothetical protein
MNENNLTENDSSIEIITLIPHNQRVWKYSFNDGSPHSINKYDIFKFLLPYTPRHLRGHLHNLLIERRSFVISVPEQEIIELTFTKGQVSTNLNLSEKQLNAVSRQIRKDSNPEKTPNDQLLNKILKKALL